MTTRFIQLDPRPQGAEGNETVFASGKVIGIEVTIPALASRCVVNLDHHQAGDTAETPSACQQALKCAFPAIPLREWEKAIFVTVRPDADSVTAMAVLKNRSEDRPVSEELVQAVGLFDRYGPSMGRPSDTVFAIARKACDFKVALAERVLWVSDLLVGNYKGREIAELVAAHDSELVAARNTSLLVSYAEGRIVYVESTHRFATTLGYELAPVVVAFNPAMPVDPKDASKGTYRKFTVCRYDSHVKCDLPAALVELQALEAGWGGRGDIFGSPQGASSILMPNRVIEVVSHHLK